MVSHVADRLPSRENSPSRLVFCFVTLSLFLMGCGRGDSSHSDLKQRISAQDIATLGPQATLDDVARLLGGFPLADNALLFFHPAKENEDGQYWFIFLPTNEISDPSFNWTAAPPKLVAVVYAESYDDFVEGRSCRYVWPKNVSGRRYTGMKSIPPPEN